MMLDAISRDINSFRQKIVFGLFVFLIVVPSFFGGEWSKWLQAAILVSTSLLAFYLIILIGQRTIVSPVSLRSVISSPISYLVVFLLAVAVSVFFSSNHYDSISLLFLLAGYVIIFFGAILFFREWRWVRLIINVVFFVGAIAALISLVMFAFQAENRGSGFLFNANALGSYLLFSLPIGIMLTAQKAGKKIRFFFYACLGIIIAAFALTYSYTSWVSFIIPGMMLVIFFRKTLFTRKKIFIGALLIFVMLAVVVVFRYSQSQNWSEAVKIHSTINKQHLITSFNQRLNFDRAAIRMVQESPLIGFGYNTFQLVYARYATSLLEQPRYTHNYYLQTAAETGIIGGLAFMAFVVLLVARTYKKSMTQVDPEKKIIFFGVWISVVGSAIHSLFDFGWQFPAVFILFWMCIGAMSAKNSEQPEPAVGGITKVNRGLIITAQVMLALVAIAFLVRGCTLFLGVNNFQKGEQAAITGDFEISYNYYDQGGRFDPDPSYLINEVSALGIGYQVLSKDQQSKLKENLKTALKRNPEYYSGHFYLGQLHYADREESEALQEYEQAIYYNPVFRPDFYYSAALVYFNRKDYDNSQKTIITILDKYGSLEQTSNPNLPTQLAFLHLLLGQNFEAVGDNNNARSHFQEAVRLRPGFSLAEQKLKELP